RGTGHDGRAPGSHPQRTARGRRSRRLLASRLAARRSRPNRSPPLRPRTGRRTSGEGGRVVRPHDPPSRPSSSIILHPFSFILPPMLSSEPLLSALQASLSPVVLISGIGLLLLSMTNRLGRVVDRSRALARDIRASGLDAAERKVLRLQIRILFKRGRLLVAAIGLCVLSLFLTAVLVGYLFLHFKIGRAHV